MGAKLYYRNSKKGTGGYILHCFDVYNQGYNCYPADEVMWGDCKITCRVSRVIDFCHSNFSRVKQELETVATYEIVDGKPNFTFYGPEAKRLTKNQEIYRDFVDYTEIVENMGWFIQEIRKKFSFDDFLHLAFCWKRNIDFSEQISNKFKKHVQEVVEPCLRKDKEFCLSQWKTILKNVFYDYAVAIEELN